MIKNKVLNLTDENGKSFSTSMEDFIKMVSISDLEEGGSMDVYDSEKQLTDFPGLTIVDSEGNPFDVATMNDSDSDKKIIGLDVLIETTHSGQNANNVVYYSDSMENDATTMMAPYQKPLIRNHDSYSEPMGRIQNVFFGPSEFTERDTINAVFRVTEEDAMEKFLDGRYRTVSIGANAGRVSCDICGKDILKDGVMKFCGHWKGETYANKKATWSCRDLTYNEVSVVNNPADKWAQVKKITVVTAGDKKPGTDEKVGDSEMKNAKNLINDSKTETEDLIGSILNEDNVTPADPTDPVVEDAAPEEPVAAVEDTENKEPEKTVEDYLLMIQGLNDKVETLTAENATLSDKITGMEDKMTDLNDKMVAAEAESKISRDQSLRLAVKYKSLLVDSVKTVNSIVKDEITDEEIEAKSMKELSDLADSLKSRIPVVHATPTPATNPGVVDNKEPNVITDDEEKPTAKASIVDVQDLLKDMIDSATR